MPVMRVQEWASMSGDAGGVARARARRHLRARAAGVDRRAHRRRPRARRRGRLRCAREVRRCRRHARGPPRDRRRDRRCGGERRRRRGDRRRDRPPPRLQRAAARALGRMGVRVRAGLTVGEKITPIASAGLFTPSGKGQLPQRHLPGSPCRRSSPACRVSSPSSRPCRAAAAEVDPAVLVVSRELGSATCSASTAPPAVAPRLRH